MSRPPVTSDSIVTRNPAPLATEVDGEMMMMSLDSGEYYGLDAIATDIWKRLETPMRVSALAAALAADYDGDTAIIAADLLRFLDSLAERGLLDVRP